MHYSTEWLHDENQLENYCYANGNCCFNHCPDNCPYYTQSVWPNPIFIPDYKKYLTILAQAIKESRFLPKYDEPFDYIAEQLTDAGLSYEQAVYLMYNNTLNMEELTYTIVFNDDTTLDIQATSCPTIQELNEYYDLHPDYNADDQIQSIWLGKTRIYPIPFNL